jgi:hypothetical protein
VRFSVQRHDPNDDESTTNVGSQSDRQARDFKLFARFPNGEIWVHKWGSLGSQMGMAICIPTDRREALSCFLGSQRGKSGLTNGDRWVPSWAR